MPSASPPDTIPTMTASLPVHPATLEQQALLKQCQVRRKRAGGPGGQRRNKVETAIELTHLPTGVTAAAAERREQAANLKSAIFRLRMNLALSQRGYFRPQDVPSELWQQRASQGRIRVNPSHDDFPSLLAEVLDILDAKAADPARAALLFNVSASQIIKLLKQEPRAFAWLNEKRQQLGLHPLK